MSYIRGIEDNQNLIKKRTIENHEKEISLCNEGISLLADAYTLLDGTDFLITKEHAVRLLIWGYLGAVQSTFLWCFSAACTGQYRISIVILRVLIEEIITSHYFIKYPEKAFETIDRASKNANISRVRFEPDIYKKFNAVGIKQNDSLYKFYQEISERYSHSSSTALPFHFDDEQRQILVEEPIYKVESFTKIATYILRLMAKMILFIQITFPEIDTLSPKWSEKSKKLHNEIMRRENQSS
ncbi:MAG: hypothetical protein HN736_01310 [Anaerolineae bacterium]|jgi:hypothetical protein|nr:hypothetical protein [Anaerolineae bacterium]MBT3713630.1 hypothetical protein [Anaerolineae bacterium]MBT4309481.1 hypothetical protein [Anaerolineae bacterium]MBT4459471.1 hypothetical protein [Anaerolineae bacterium]MBT4842395.1 hypothetical protein [Anaerolineae bacterium]